jgi:hypothetical protein
MVSGTAYNFFYYPYASLTNTQLPLLEVTPRHCDIIHLLDPVGASRVTIGADWPAR